MKKILGLMLLLVVIGNSIIVTAEQNVEYDCSNWAVDNVTMANIIGIVDDKTYSYSDPISRKDFCELIYNLILQTDYFENWYNEQTKGGTQEIAPFAKRPFDDTDSEAVYILYNHNIVQGKTLTEFAPDDTLTREEAATIIVRMINTVQPLPTKEKYYAYDDIDQMSEWSLQSIQTISNLGFMKGVGSNRFAPKDNLTTEQAITTVLRVYNVFKNNSVLKFVDKDGNIILTQNDIVSCNTAYNEIIPGTGEEWYVEIILTSEAREKFKKATKYISKYAENYISVIVDNSVVSEPRVMEEIDSESVLVMGEFTEESAKAFKDVICLEK